MIVNEGHSCLNSDMRMQFK